MKGIILGDEGIGKGDRERTATGDLLQGAGTMGRKRIPKDDSPSSADQGLEEI